MCARSHVRWRAFMHAVNGRTELTGFPSCMGVREREGGKICGTYSSICSGDCLCLVIVETIAAINNTFPQAMPHDK